MWQKLMRTWLIGAAVTLAAPEGALRAETNVNPNDNITGNSDRDARDFLASTETRKSTPLYNGEPSLDELMADPICQALMRRDGVTPHSLTTIIDSWRTERSSDSQEPEDG